MYRISVPLMNSNVRRAGREQAVAELRRLGASRVLLAMDEYTTDAHARARAIEELRDNCAFFSVQGFEVGAWFWAFLFPTDTRFTHMQSADGKISKFCCPADEDFRAFACEYVSEIAKTGVSFILFDDDLRYQNMHATHCFCARHMRYASSLLGEEIEPKELLKKAFSGKQNKYRDAFLNARGDILRTFAKEIRDAVDQVDPTIRIGACTCFSSWSSDGVSPFEIGRILAGKNKPLLRGVGSPYWAEAKAFGTRLGDVIELERMQGAAKEEGFEIFSEGDVYPRPRYKVPAAYLELFDSALRADGHFDGILKYAIEYTADVVTETGYTDRHVKNRPLYAWIDKNMSKKETVGARIYTNNERVRTMDFDRIDDECAALDALSFSPAFKACAALSIPSVHEGLGRGGIAFGDDVRAVPSEAYRHGIVLDAGAAEILADKGVDVGLRGKFIAIRPKNEVFPEQGNAYLRVNYEGYSAEIDEKAIADSYYEIDEGQSTHRLPASYYYTNKEGGKFFVLMANAYFNDESFLRSYPRAEQLRHALETMSEKSIPHFSKPNPDLYIMVKETENETVIGLWNIFPDSVLSPTLSLGSTYRRAEGFGCTVLLDEDKAVLSNIAPFGFCGLRLIR